MIRTLLVANRGEIAVRIMRAAAELGIRTVAVYSEDDANSLHMRRADDSRRLEGQGAAAYLDGEQIVRVAQAAGCDAIHPGYGFLSENAAFARHCHESGIVFVGPRPATLETLGDKIRARALAQACGVPLLRGSGGRVTVEGAEAFLESLGAGGAMVIKAVAGGGGRGMRIVERREDIPQLYARCQSEALQAFGNGDVYVEQLMRRARHVEVQVLGDAAGAVSQLWERECTAQRRHQKMVEVAPAPGLSAGVRERITGDAVRMASAAKYLNAGTFEFLVDAEREGEGAYAFIEANPRLQVEHTVTEEVLGIDLVKAQLRIASGQTLADQGLAQRDIPPPRGYAIQVRVNAERITEKGQVFPASGTLTLFEAPSGPGVRTDTYGYAGYRTNPNFDSLIAKVVTHSTSPEFGDAAAKAYRALCEFRVDGVQTNIPFLQNIVRHPDFVEHRIYTRFVEDHAVELAAADPEHHPRLFFEQAADRAATAGAKIDSVDPLAVLAYGRSGEPAPAPTVVATAAGPAAFDASGLEDTVAVSAPMQATVVSVGVAEGEMVGAGQQLLVVNAMKMEHEILAPAGGLIRRVRVAAGDTVHEGEPLVFIEEREGAAAAAAKVANLDLDRRRPDLDAVDRRHATTLDAARPEAVAKRRSHGQRTARENIADLCDPGTFTEYGSLAIAAQRRRRSIEDLIQNTPADGMVAGIGSVNGSLFDERASQVIAMSYDYMVLAGTQGTKNHLKKDRMFELAERLRLPIVFFAEGGGGRPGDTDNAGVSGLDVMAFHLLGKLSGLVPLVGVTTGRCFAGNAAILGCCDVVIATEGSNIGMGGPAMIEGGGLGVFRPEDVGPMSVQVPNGVVDIAVRDEAEAVQVAKQYLSYFQGAVKEWGCPDQRLLRNVIPENRLRVYDIREVMETLADGESVLEIRRDFGPGMVTALARIEGRPIGIIANNPMHLSGAIDSPGADKAARFMQLCDAYDIPILFLCDTPGIMVGPEVEKTALVRHCSRMFVVGANLTVPYFTIVLRKSYGLGAQAMGGGSHKAPIWVVAWPTGEFGGMGLEGAVKLGQRRELEAVDDPAERKALFDELVAASYERGKALNAASHFEIDDVIDPAESRQWIMAALRAAPPPGPRTHKKRPNIDTW